MGRGIGITALALGLSWFSLAQSPRPAVELHPNQAVQRESGPAQQDVFNVQLAAGQLAHVALRKKTVDVLLTVTDPAGKLILTADFPGSWGALPATWIASTAGVYRVRVNKSDRSQEKGRYTLELAELRESTEGDARRIEAETKFYAAAALERFGGPDRRAEAIQNFAEAASLWRELKDSDEEAMCLYHAGLLESDLGEPRKAIEQYEQALSLWHSAGDQTAEANTLGAMGTAYLRLGEQEKALECHQKALALRRALDDKLGQEAALNTIGNIYTAQGDPQQALDYYQKSLGLAHASGDRAGEIRSLSLVGMVYRDLGAEQKALEYFQQVLPLERAAGDHDAESNTLIAFGDAYFFLGEKNRSLDYYQQALALKRTLKDRSGEALTLIGIGNVYSDLGSRQKVQDRATPEEKRKAVEYYEQALLMGRSLHDPSVEVFGRMGAGVVYSALGDKKKAFDYINQALFLFNMARYRPGEGWALYEKARVERDRGNLVQARSLVSASRNIIESLRTNMISQELRATFVAAVHDCHELEVDVLMRLHENDPAGHYDAEALTASERARARVLLETLSEAHANIREGVDPALLEREEALEVQLNAKEMARLQMVASGRPDEQVAVMTKAVAALTSQYEDVRTAIRIRSPHYAALNFPQPLNLAEIQSQVLDPETILLEYALGEQRSFLWVVSTDGVSSVMLPKRNEVEDAARIYRVLLSNPEGTVSLEAGRTLSRMLLGEAAAKLGNKRLLVVADGALQYVPFAALPDPNAPDQPLIVGHEIVSIPSASTVAVLRRENSNRKEAPKMLAVLADPVFSGDDPRLSRAREKTMGMNVRRSDDVLQRSSSEVGLGGTRLPRLPGTRREATAIGALVPSSQQRVALDFDASRATLMNPELAQYRILHLATHGLLNSAHPELSGVVLSLVDGQGKPQDGFLRLHEIYNLKLAADLVVLSACQTGLGQEIRGEGLVGLTRGFMYAGAQRVVASLWKVDDRATAELMKRFYGSMLGDAKMSPAAALRAAQTAMWQTKGWESPYYWSAFVLQGDWK